MAPTTLARKTKQRATLTTTVNQLITSAISTLNSTDEVAHKNETLLSIKDVLLEKYAKIQEFNEEIINLLLDIDARNIYLNQILNHYWERWRLEYITELREYHKSKKGLKDSDVKVDDVVILQDDKLPRALCRIGIIKSIVKSKDNKSRAATVRSITPDGRVSYLTRPVSKLVMLEASKRYDVPALTFVDENNVIMF